jgi:VWFA-related protein
VGARHPGGNPQNACLAVKPRRARLANSAEVHGLHSRRSTPPHIAAVKEFTCRRSGTGKKGSAIVPSYLSFATAILVCGLASPAFGQSADVVPIASSNAILPTGSARPAFQSGVDLVALTVTVTDNANQYVRDLAQADFTVFEDGVAQPLTFFGLSNVPLDLALLVDTSASMQSQMATVRQAAAGLLRTLKSGDRASLVEFKDQVAVSQPMTEDLDRVAIALAGLSARGGTSLYNALYVTLRDFQKAAVTLTSVRRKAIVVLSDGADTGSLISFDDVIDLARRTGVTVYTVALQSEMDRLRQATARRRYFSQADYAMRSLAQETGAQAFFPENAADVRGVYEAIASELACQYALGYSPRNPARNGAWRRLVVRVANRPGIRSRTRTGYFAGAGARVLAAAMND